MARVTANIRENGRPLKKVFVEHIALGFHAGMSLTDSNGSFTFDAGPGFDHVDIKIHCQNSVIRVLDGSAPLPFPISIVKNVGNGDSVNLVTAIEKKNHFRILNMVLDVYDTVWRQFKPFSNNSRGDFPLGRRSILRDTFSSSTRIELSFPDNFPSPLAFVEPAGLSNAGFPLVHIKSQNSDQRLFGSATQDPSLIPHELGHVMHFSSLTGSTRISIEAQYIQFILGNPNPFHNVDRVTNPFVAFIEAVGIFSERFFFFKKRVAPNLNGVPLRQAFFRNELNEQTLAVRTRGYVDVGRKVGGVVNPVLRGSDREGAVYGAIYLDFASRPGVGLREAVGLVLESNATSFRDFRTFILGRGNAAHITAINAVRNTWGM